MKNKLSLLCGVITKVSMSFSGGVAGGIFGNH